MKPKNNFVEKGAFLPMYNNVIKEINIYMKNKLKKKEYFIFFAYSNVIIIIQMLKWKYQ